MMATISRQGQLSQRYTNHSIRSTVATADGRAVDVNERPEIPPSPARSPILSDSDLPSTPNLNQIMNTVLSPVMFTSTDVFKYNRFQGCTININVKK